MQEENNKTPQPTITTNSPAQQSAGTALVPIVSGEQDRNETLMLIFGILTVLSLLFNQGVLLKLFAAVFLVIAVLAIVRNTKQSGAPEQSQHGAVGESTKKRWSLRKKLTVLAIVLIVLPVVGFGAFILFIILMFSVGGANMGT